MTAETIRMGIFDMQVCVPEYWDNQRVLDFANTDNPCGISRGWFIRQQGSKYLAGASERTPCEERPGHVHIMLDA